MRSSACLSLLIPAVLLMGPAGCAPRVSKRGPQPVVAAAPVADTPRAAPVEAPATEETQLALAPAPAPAAETPPPAWKPAAESPPPEAEPAEEAPAPAKATKRTYYGYSDAELVALRKQSPEFKKLEQQLKVCTAKSTGAIERREEIPAEIAKIRMSKGGLTPQKEKKIEKLKAEQARLKSADAGQCGPIEDRLTAMLQSTYDAEAALY